jgi:hypothetical protein
MAWINPRIRSGDGPDAKRERPKPSCPALSPDVSRERALKPLDIVAYRPCSMRETTFEV